MQAADERDSAVAASVPETVLSRLIDKVAAMTRVKDVRTRLTNIETRLGKIHAHGHKATQARGSVPTTVAAEAIEREALAKLQALDAQINGNPSAETRAALLAQYFQVQGALAAFQKNAHRGNSAAATRRTRAVDAKLRSVANDIRSLEADEQAERPALLTQYAALRAERAKLRREALGGDTRVAPVYKGQAGAQQEAAALAFEAEALRFHLSRMGVSDFDVRPTDVDHTKRGDPLAPFQVVFTPLPASGKVEPGTPAGEGPHLTKMDVKRDQRASQPLFGSTGALEITAPRQLAKDGGDKLGTPTAQGTPVKSAEAPKKSPFTVAQMRRVQALLKKNATGSMTEKEAEELVAAERAQREYDEWQERLDATTEAESVAAALPRTPAEAEQAANDTRDSVLGDDDAVSRLRTVDDLGTPLTVGAIRAANAGNTGAVVANIERVSDNDFARRVAAALRPFLAGVKTRLVDEMPGSNPTAPGGISADGRNISLRRENGLTEESTLHEGAHAATIYNLQRPESELSTDQVAAKRELERLHKEAKADPALAKNESVQGDLLEFVAESLGSRKVAAVLAKTPGNSLWKRFKNAVLRLIGFNVPPEGNARDKVLDLAEKFFRPPQEGDQSNATAFKQPSYYYRFT